MSDRSSIEWTDASWNPIRARHRATSRVGWHCEHVSEGCRNCYAETFNRRLGTQLDYKPGHLKARTPRPRGLADIFLDEKMLLAPLKWRKPRKIFVCSMTDLFADFVSDEMIDQVFAVMALSPQHHFQVLTKRPERMREYLTRSGTDRPTAGERLNRCGIVWDVAYGVAARDFGQEARFTDALRARGVTMDAMPWPLSNVWLGVSVEDQAAADERIPILLDTPAAVRWLSCEPLLGPVDLTGLMVKPSWVYEPFRGVRYDPMRHPDYGDVEEPTGRISWVVAGGESGRTARAMHPDWARALRDQCASAGVPFLFKQWGEWAPAKPESARGNPRSGWRAFRGHGGMPPKREELYPEAGAAFVAAVGKKAAGRLLDGVQHDGYPA